MDYGYVISCFYKLLQTVSFSQVFMSGDKLNRLYVVGTREYSIVFKRIFYIQVKTITTLLHTHRHGLTMTLALKRK